MRKNTLLSAVLFLSLMLIFQACKKDDPEQVPVDNTPSLTFITDPPYISSDTTLEANTEFKVGIQGVSNTSIKLAVFKVVRNYNNVPTTVFENNSVDELFLSWETNQFTIDVVGEETWTFSITDYSGQKKEISFVITTTANISPLMVFNQGSNYVSRDTSLTTASEFKLGVNCQQSPISNSDLASFKVEKTFNNVNTTVYENLDIGAPEFLWDVTEYCNSEAGEETWVFTLEDESGKTNELSFIVTTTGPYTPAFSVAAFPYFSGSWEFIWFEIICLTDDIEPITVTITLQGGSTHYIYGLSGYLYTEGTPIIINSDIAVTPDVFELIIKGIVKSGANTNEQFTATKTVSID